MKNEKDSKDTVSLTLAIKLLRQQTLPPHPHKRFKCPQLSHDGRKQAEVQCQSEGQPVPKTETLHRSNNFSDHLTEQTGAQTVMGGAHLDQHCLAMHTSCSLFKPNSLVRTLKMDLLLFVPFPVWPDTEQMFFCSSCLFC